MTDPPLVRRSAVAGSFYPGDAKTLRTNLDALLGNVPSHASPGRPVVLIEPHAGYVYSGSVAAHGYKLLQSCHVETVVVISPSHMEYFPFVSIFEGDAYETPLGRIPVDKSMARELASKAEQLQMSERGHIQTQLSCQEHALEVQLPFLQAVLDRFDIVPIVMGDQSWEACRVLGDALGPFLKRSGVLVVASSDLSHFYPYDVAKEMDGIFLDRLRRMEPWQLYESVKQKSCEACGTGPVIAGVIAAQHMNSATCHILSSANSGDVTGDRDRVVGYASAVIFEPVAGVGDTVQREEHCQVVLDSTERAYLLDSARRSIEAVVGGVVRPATLVCESPLLEERHGAFVTLKVRGRLRGCIGSVEPQKPIGELIGEMSVAAATGDPRFHRMTADELGQLVIEISILTPLRRIRGPREIEIGRHGLLVRRGGHSGLLLPQVAEEQGWDVIEFLERAGEKAALGPDAWQDQATRLYVFTATVFGEEKEITH